MTQYRISIHAVLLACALLVLGTGSRSVANQDIPKGSPEAQLFVDRIPTRGELASRHTGARFEPPFGCYLGAFIDFDGSLHRPYMDENRTVHQDPSGFEDIVNRAHASYFFYLGYGRKLPVDWVRWLGQHNKFVHIALEPNDGLDRVKDNAYLRQLAEDMARTKAKIFLRFGSEMNGTWTKYHKPVEEYRRKFRLVYRVMHQRTSNVALVWCPYAMPLHNIPDYYPGDDATDWVGVNMYSVTYHDNNIGVNAEDEHPADLLETVYKKYAARKPFMICEFAATHFGACEGKNRSEFASRKILTLYNALPRRFPRVKCINYFDSNNIQFVKSRGYNDYSVTDDPEITAAYRFAVSSAWFLDRPTSDKAAAPPLPMPVRPDEPLRGLVRLSCWARGKLDKVWVKYLVDGYAIYEGKDAAHWECLWNAGSVRPGRHTLSLVVTNRAGQRRAFQSITVRTLP